MITIEQLYCVLAALPDPAFLLSRQGKYIAVFGGKDSRYYHDGSQLVGLSIADLISPEKSAWFLEKIDSALRSKKLLIEEYELSNKDVKGLPDVGPLQPIWFEGRIQALDFLIDGQEVVLWVASNISERHQLEMQLRELSDTDQLTGLYNRRRLEQELTLQFALFHRHATTSSIILLDLDNLKQINDTQGHAVGDEAIRIVAKHCQAQARQADIVCRFGGDEFVIALPTTNQQQAVQFANRLRQELNLALARFCIENTQVSVSLGVAEMHPSDVSYEDTLKRADHALYEAKRRGKNSVVAA